MNRLTKGQVATWLLDPVTKEIRNRIRLKIGEMTEAWLEGKFASDICLDVRTRGMAEGMIYVFTEEYYDEEE